MCLYPTHCVWGTTEYMGGGCCTIPIHHFSPCSPYPGWFSPSEDYFQHLNPTMGKIILVGERKGLAPLICVPFLPTPSWSYDRADLH